MKTIILIIAIILMVTTAVLSIALPQLMVRKIGKSLERFKIQEGIPIMEYHVIVCGKRCESMENGTCRNIRKAQDCEMAFRFEDGSEKLYEVPYGVYEQIPMNQEGTLYLQEDEFRDFREIY